MDILKKGIRSILPPFIWNGIRKASARKGFSPQWNAFSFAPIKGVRMFFDPSGAWQRKMLSGSYDSFFFDRITALQPAGKVIYDIGSHIGFHALYFAALVGDKGTVAAFEPNRANYERLKKNIDGNPSLSLRIKAFNIAASDAAGTISFTTKDDIESGRSMGGFLDNAETHWNKEVYAEKGFSASEVKADTVDSMVASLDIPAPDIMKIDVEGAEYQVLKGSRLTLLTKKPVLFIEVHSIHSMFDVMAFLRSVSYSVELIKQEPSGVCFIQANPK